MSVAFRMVRGQNPHCKYGYGNYKNSGCSTDEKQKAWGFCLNVWNQFLLFLTIRRQGDPCSWNFDIFSFEFNLCSSETVNGAVPKKRYHAVKDDLAAFVESKKKSDELSKRREEELLRTIAAMQERINQLEGTRLLYLLTHPRIA